MRYVVLFLALCGLSQAQRKYVTFDAPGCGNTAGLYIANSGAVLGSCSPGSPFFWRNAKGVFSNPKVPVLGSVSGLDAKGLIVGSWPNHGIYLMPGKRTVKFQVDGITQATAVSHSGLIAGSHHGGYGQPLWVGFILNGLDNITLPGAWQLFPAGINDTGELVGSWLDEKGGSHAFIWDPVNQQPIPYDAPGSVSTIVSGINDAGTVVGLWSDGQMTHAFTLDATGTFTSFDAVAGDSESTIRPPAINDNGWVVGVYADTNYHTFLRSPKGAITLLDVPGAVLTIATSINSTGHVTGFYYDGQNTNGFIY